MLIHDFFPKPVGEIILQPGISDAELDFAKKEKCNSVKNLGNLISKNNHILEEPIFEQLKASILKNVNVYFNEIFNNGNCSNVELYITTSWLNWAETDEYHHDHTHANSLISGVLYFDVCENIDSISFCNPNADTILGNIIISQSEHKSRWLANDWVVSVKKNMLILFPSTMKHGVLPRQYTPDCKTRISLSFNTWVKGVICNNTNFIKF
jgi:uncharacterized protein (TIGR02466 family)